VELGARYPKLAFAPTQMRPSLSKAMDRVVLDGVWILRQVTPSYSRISLPEVPMKRMPRLSWRMDQTWPYPPNSSRVCAWSTGTPISTGDLDGEGAGAEVFVCAPAKGASAGKNTSTGRSRRRRRFGVTNCWVKGTSDGADLGNREDGSREQGTGKREKGEVDRENGKGHRGQGIGNRDLRSGSQAAGVDPDVEGGGGKEGEGNGEDEGGGGELGGGGGSG